MSIMPSLYEKRPLKKPRIGPPDVYPQEPKQKEDELTSLNVKHGFTTMPQLSDEFGTARNCNVTASRVGAYFNAIIAKKEELCTLQDSGRKRQQINTKDHFWPAIVRNKHYIEAWFKDLAGSKPLMTLGKRAPNFNKKEEIFMMLSEYQVPMLRATWFIKLSSAYTIAVSEAKNKKRQLPDPTTEWTGTLIKFLKDQLPKLQDHYHMYNNSLANLDTKNVNNTQQAAVQQQQQNSNGMTPTHTSGGGVGGTSGVVTNLTTTPMHSPAQQGNTTTTAAAAVGAGGGGAAPAAAPGSGGGGNTCLASVITQSTESEFKIAHRQWTYCSQLAKYMYEEGLLDRSEFLNLILELLDRMRAQPSDDGILRLILPFALQYVDEIVQSELLSRRIAYLCAKKLTHLCNSIAEANLTTTTSISSAAASITTTGSSITTTTTSTAAAASAGSDLNHQKTDHHNHNHQHHNHHHQTTTINDKDNNMMKKDTMNMMLTTTSLNGPLQATIQEYLNCPHHKDIILQLSCILQVITLECSTALVWCGIGESRSNSIWHGSPLDCLPAPPSQLPLPSRMATCGVPSNGSYTTELRKRLRLSEDNIRERSKRAEGRWCTDKWQCSSSGQTTSKVLAALDALDRHRFDRVDTTNSLDTLYTKIFPAPGSKESTTSLTTSTTTTTTSSSSSSSTTTNNNNNNNNSSSTSSSLSSSTPNENKESRNEYNVNQDEPIIQILCEWAVSNERWGEHRAMAVAWLLDKRQQDVSTPEPDSTNASDDKDSVSSLNNQPSGLPIFQNLFMKFLDDDAPILEENGTSQNRAMFTNLVHLFAELIRHDVFSHDAYMCTLISRGDLISTGAMNGSAGIHRPPSPPPNPGLDDEIFGLDLKSAKLDVSDHDDSKIDDDLDKLLQHIKEDQQNSLDAPDSPKDPDHHHHHSNMMSSNISIPMETDHTDLKIRPSRHLLYTTHFPLTQDETYSQHDCNQRHVLLYGVGKVRDEARHTVKKMSKEICKLFSKKFSIDVAEGGKVKKHSRNEFNFELATQKCQNLSYFDQHVVTWQCSLNVIEMLNSFGSGNSNYLPVQEHVAFLFDLMELALNIYGLIDVCISILKELPEVEAQLLLKGSTLARNYTTSLSLYVVGVLRRYHCCLLLSAEQTWLVFDGLCKVVKHVSTPGDCSSAERCVLAHLYDLYSSCHLLKQKPHTEFANANPKIRIALYSALQPSTTNNYVYNAHYMQEFFGSPRRGKIETSWARQLAESPNNRYSFVINAIVTVCRETDNERLNDISVMCAEVTACCNSLSAEWVGALMALCYATNNTIYMDLLTQVDVQDLSIHNSLAVFTSILIARHCFSLEDFVKHIALPNLVKVSKEFNEGRGGGGDNGVTCGGGNNVEAGARLTCHLLLRLFKTVECPQPGLYSVSTSPHPLPTSSQNGYSIRLSCDRHLLAAAHNNIKVGPVLAVLKAILVVGDATSRERKLGSKRDGGNGSSTHSGSSSNSKAPTAVPGELSISHILGTSDMLGGGDDGMLDITMVELEATSTRSSQRQSVSSDGTTSLSKFAWHVLREICSQQWVLERCLSQPEELFQSDLLLDSMLTSSQAQRLLHMICYPDMSSSLDELDQKSIITRILENLEQWTLRMSWLDLQLMFKQFNNNTSELNQWLDTVAKAAIDVFQLNSNADFIHNNEQQQQQQQQQQKSLTSTTNMMKYDFKGKSGSIWLVAPLVSKLPSAVQGRVLKVAGQVLETNNWPAGKRSSGGSGGGGSDNKDMGLRTGGRRYHSSTSLLSHQPFLSLVLTCLKGQDDQREGLLTSLHSQLSQFLTLSKDERIGTCEIGNRESMLDALQLRFSLVGGMFDTVQRNTTTTTDWAVLLVQLISYGVIDLNNNSELFTTVLDMLATLVHSTLVSDSQSEKDESKKHYQNLQKKLKKELGDRNSPSIQYVRQLLQLPKRTCEVIACEPVGCLTDTKGNKITGFDSIDKKQGLRVSDKQRVSPWDLLEGQKSPAPLSWSWFGAVRLERKPLWYEDTHRLLKYHTHSLLRPAAHYLDSVPLPPEDLEPIQEKPLKDYDDLKADTPSSLDQSPSQPSAALGKVRCKNSQRRSRKPKQVGPCGGQIPGVGAGGVGISVGQQNQMGGPNGGGGSGGGPGQGQQMQMGQNNVMHPQHPQNMGAMNMGVGGVQAPPQQGQMGQMGGYGQQMGNIGPQQNFQGNQGPQQWGYNQQQQPQQPQQGYYGQQMPGVSRYERPQVNQSKQALTNMLRQRHPLNHFLGGQGGGAQVPPGGGQMPGAYGGMQRQFPRQPMRGPQQQHPAANMQQNQNMFQQQYGNMQQGGMNQNYGGAYGNQQVNTAANNQQQGQMMQAGAGVGVGVGVGVGPQPNMMGSFPNQQTGFGPQTVGNAAAMMGQRTPSQSDYLNQQQQQQQQQQQRMGQPNRPQYLQAPNVTMNTMGPLGNNQGGPAPPYSRTAGGGKPTVQPNQQQTQQQFQQQVNQQRLRQQQMMAMQQQQQQQQQQSNVVGQGGGGGGGGGSAQPPSALVAHLQRSMQQQGQQHNPYHQQPPQYQ